VVALRAVAALLNVETMRFWNYTARHKNWRATPNYSCEALTT
jgi:hypothetical protein